MPTVVILQRALPHYRVPFFEGLRQYLAQHGVELELWHGPPLGKEALKKDAGALPWAEEIPLHAFLGDRLIWHPVLGRLLKEKPALIIAEQANRNLINLALLALKGAGAPPLALWGHGRNRQAAPNASGNQIKLAYLKKAYWFFAYTEGVAKDVADAGYPANRITAVQNAVDTAGFARELETVSEKELASFRQQHGLTAGHTALYCGGMYAEKQIPLLLEAADLVKSRIEDFSLLAVGAGQEAHLFADAAQTRPWLKVLGPKFGHEKALCFAAADVFVMPGLVGLAILDSFTAGLPLLTTDYPFHSPEIEYVDPGKNGFITPFSAKAFADGLVSLLQNPNELTRLKAGAKESARRYTVEQMVENFGEGILAALRA